MKRLPLSTLLLSLGLLVAVVAALSFFLSRNEERAQRIWAEGELRKMTDAKEALEKERDELTKAKEILETQLNESNTQVKNLTEEAKDLSEQLASEKRAREGLTGELARTRTSLETERREKLTLTEELAKAKQSYQALSNELVTLRQAKEALEKRVKEMLAAQAAEAEKIVVRPPAVPGAIPPAAAASPGAAALPAATPATAPAPLTAAAATPAKPLEGKVLVVNREFNFVVVNLGSRDGLRIGDSLTLWRGGKAIGNAQVERIYDNMSAATLSTEELKTKVQEGDLVRPSY